MGQQRRVGLGKGLGALIPTGPLVDVRTPGGTAAAPSQADDGLKPIDGAYFMEVPLDAITRNPRQPREIFDEDALRELADSIREVGLLQPIVVRQVGGGRYELIMGERRWRASQLLDLKVIPAIVRDTQDDALLRDALIENLQREQLNALEEAAAYRQLLDDFGATHEQLAQRVGRSRSHITNTLRLLNLPTGVQWRVAAGTISAGHARALLALSDPAAQEHLADRIVAEGLSVRTVEEIVSMGEATAAPALRPRRQKALPEPALTTLADRLSDHFETRVRVDLGRHKGRIVVEFATMDDLERIITTMAPNAAPTLHTPHDEP
ncbi:ParB/RepB/Spo0J family partition protein [Sphaerisporangium aureirubrum]|uniref:ParB/RepB/Spo0J family partition protein n=1 Tax=Sphaerisporangium aureirubrum TaxID=1544736 RepID=A0ABW1NR50_9ACTN